MKLGGFLARLLRKDRPLFARARRSLRALIAEAKGVALVETALAAPFLVTVIMGTVDLARYGAAKLKVQQAVNRGLEMSWMGGTSLSTADIQAQAAAQANVPTSSVTVTQTLECGGTAATWGSSCTTGQETAAYTKIQISTTFTPSFVLGTFAQLYASTNGAIPITVSGVLRIQ